MCQFAREESRLVPVGPGPRGRARRMRALEAVGVANLLEPGRQRARLRVRRLGAAQVHRHGRRPAARRRQRPRRLVRGGGRKVEAFLVDGPGKQARPGVVLVHGGGADRSELLGDAVALAHLGFIALAITAPSSAHPTPLPTTVQGLVSDSKAVTVADVVAVRRAADVLASLPAVDAKRLGYLGWSNGRQDGRVRRRGRPEVRGARAALGRRRQALGVRQGGSGGPEGARRERPRQRRPAPVHRDGRGGTVLLADGRRDTVVPRAALENMIHAAPKGTLVRWYDTGHALNAAAYRATFGWLVEKLRPAARPRGPSVIKPLGEPGRTPDRQRRAIRGRSSRPGKGSVRGLVQPALLPLLEPRVAAASTNPSVGLRERKKQRTRQAIVEAATRLFAAHGYAETTLAEVAEEAEVALSTIFNYFPGKPDIVFAMMDASDRERADARRRDGPTGRPRQTPCSHWVREVLPELERPYTEAIRRSADIIRSDPDLVAAERLRGALLEDEIALGFARDLDEDPPGVRSRMMAAIALRRDGRRLERLDRHAPGRRRPRLRRAQRAEGRVPREGARGRAQGDRDRSRPRTDRQSLALAVRPPTRARERPVVRDVDRVAADASSSTSRRGRGRESTGPAPRVSAGSRPRHSDVARSTESIRFGNSRSSSSRRRWRNLRVPFTALGDDAGVEERLEVMARRRLRHREADGAAGELVPEGQPASWRTISSRTGSASAWRIRMPSSWTAWSSCSLFDLHLIRDVLFDESRTMMYGAGRTIAPCADKGAEDRDQHSILLHRRSRAARGERCSSSAPRSSSMRSTSR